MDAAMIESPKQVLETIAELPGNLAELTEFIRARNSAARRLVLTIAAGIAHARDAIFSTDASGWRTWARDEFWIDRRQAYRYLAAGRLLLDGTANATSMEILAACDLEKLEALAAIPRDQLGAVIERIHPEKLSREELRAKVKLWKEPPEDDGGDEAKKKDKDARAKKRPPKTNTLEDLIDRVATLTEKEIDAIAPLADPAACFRAALALMNLALTQLDAQNWWAPRQYEVFSATLEQALGEYRRLHEEAKLH